MKIGYSNIIRRSLKWEQLFASLYKDKKQKEAFDF